MRAHLLLSGFVCATVLLACKTANSSGVKFTDQSAAPKPIFSCAGDIVLTIRGDSLFLTQNGGHVLRSTLKEHTTQSVYADDVASSVTLKPQAEGLYGQWDGVAIVKDSPEEPERVERQIPLNCQPLPAAADALDNAGGQATPVFACAGNITLAVGGGSVYLTQNGQHVLRSTLQEASTKRLHADDVASSVTLHPQAEGLYDQWDGVAVIKDDPEDRERAARNIPLNCQPLAAANGILDNSGNQPPTPLFSCAGNMNVGIKDGSVYLTANGAHVLRSTLQENSATRLSANDSGSSLVLRVPEEDLYGFWEGNAVVKASPEEPGTSDRTFSLNCKRL